MNPTISHHNDPAADDLIRILATYCGCVHSEDGQRISRCAGHLAMETDQRFVDGLLVMRRCAAKLLEQEFGLCQPVQPRPAYRFLHVPQGL